ncbi:2-octaprenyl-3-methyl-6-methoxy-1,4-benzoquinol hydroxylase / 2-octaprenyl-6-methoxyphenol hydroxylase [Shewanella denitrificans OS217]|jgi:2-octaprenyl-6-methoxyphenol hydroxylase|uniref:2-octaprenyl-3-methyl-6-methoxy-1,4-benzoquinol hydroxylase / 2-octaprenyl-6-methoxyphenol hydroxylase n=1 Tax=Shewanella denitrificans (strain OS217 / ATCC BAA-1090 / DSM 15013) TaxID=318161 RepID=Q12R06_SHEDO|nr:2-octaprenyl-6-methoxyphenyl hydroxylase [Shewanella denitrificans]ABE54120.1 2-octaprenyl-3-methyl-6-methoxy-1,4-benzoquinol hydroxylase / 2-octaprenyl-6-methoxyphenol hydroxylase [Shewanella denitrificans OS217]
MSELQAQSQINAVDIAIVGGAMAGSILALGLRKLKGSQPLKIALIEAFEPSASHPGFDARSIALSHGSIFELTRLGLWEKLAPLGTAIEHIHVSDRGHLGMTCLDAAQFNLAAMGQVVELSRVGSVLFDELSQSDISLYCPDTLISIAAEPEHQLLTLASGARIQAKLLIAADGANSVVAQHFKLPRTQVDFNQTALVANIVSQDAHQHQAFERFTDTGPLALLPMADNAGKHRFSLVWALEPQRAAHLADAPKDEFLSQLQQAFGYRAGQFIDVGQRVSYPLSLSYMPRPQHHRCLFVGNAAQTLHPIAGQGFNLGLRDVVSLIDMLADALAESMATQECQLTQTTKELDCGNSKLLHQYSLARESDRRSTLSYIEFLVRGFSNQHWPLVAGRNLGLRLLSWCPPLKQPVGQRAMGWHKY